jgi:hypothetical protein
MESVIEYGMLPKTDRRAIRCSLGMLLLAAGLLAHPTTAGATPIVFTLSGSSFDAVSEGGTALVGQGFFTAGTMITLSGGTSGTVTGLALPGLSGGGVSYSFAAPSGSITYTLNQTTGELDFTNSIIASVTRTGPTTVAVTNPLTLATGTTNAGSPCGGLGTTPVHGSPATSPTGAVTLVGGSCGPADAGAGGPWLVQVKLIGTLSSNWNVVPEPGTAALLGCGLGGIAWAGRLRSRHR